MTTAAIRVLLADDHLVIRHGLAAILAGFNDIELVGEARNGAEAVALCATARPDVVLMDLLMPKMDGVEATRAIHEHYPQLPVILLTSWSEYDLVQRALAAGAHSYMLKSTSAVRLAAAIRLASTGETPRRVPPGQGAMLTSLERDVLAQLVEGFTNTEIAAHLSLGQPAVELHVTGLLNKLEALAHLAAAAHDPWPPEQGADLTDRERSVLAQLSRGLTISQMGEHLVLSHLTLEFHLTRIVHKLEAMAHATKTQEATPAANSVALTSRERDVLALMAQGQTNADIAGQLVVSRATAKFHVSNILRKLGAASRTEAVALAVQRQLLSEFA